MLIKDLITTLIINYKIQQLILQLLRNISTNFQCDATTSTDCHFQLKFQKVLFKLLDGGQLDSDDPKVVVIIVLRC